jgi:rubrerythrin
MSLDAGLAATGESAPLGEWVPQGEWECMECGYIEQGARTARPEVCPDCGAPGQALEFFPFEDEDENEDLR